MGILAGGARQAPVWQPHVEIQRTQAIQGSERVLNKFVHVLRTNYGTLRGWVRSSLGQIEFASGRLDWQRCLLRGATVCVAVQH